MGTDQRGADGAFRTGDAGGECDSGSGGHRFRGGVSGPKITTAQVATATLDGIEAGKLEVLVDDWSAYIKSTLAGDPAAFYTAEYIQNALASWKN